MKTLKKQLRNRRGQGMTEYILIVVLIAVVAIVTVTAFGNTVKSLFNTANAAIQGNPGTNWTPPPRGEETNQIQQFRTRGY